MTLQKYPVLSPLEKRLFLFLFIAYAFFFDTVPGWNINTRMNLVYAIVDQHQFYIDDYWNTELYGTGDVALYKDHYYCDKSPILSFMGVPVYWVWKQVSSLSNTYISPVIGRYPVVVFTVSLLSAGMAILLYRFLGYLRKNPTDQLWVTLFYSLGTLAFPYSILFFSHQVVAVFLFVAFYILYRIFRENSLLSNKTVIIGLVISGFLGGLAVVTENPAGIGFIGLLGYAFFQLKKKKQLSYFLLGSVIPILFVMPYNYVCFGSPLSFGYRHEAFTYFYQKMAEGFMGITYPKWDAVWGITFSPYRGLFFYSPILLFSIPGFYFLFRDKLFRKETLFLLFVVVSFFLFNFSYYLWNGGWGVGPRLIIPMLPFMVLPLYAFLPRWRKIVYLIGFYSILIFSLFCITDPQVRDNLYFPLKEFTLPHIFQGIFMQNILSLLGLPQSLAISIWVIYILAGLFYLHRLSKQKPPDLTGTR